MPDLALRCFRRFVEIEGTQHATVLGAQAFTSLIPFLVVASVFAPGDADLSERIVDRFGLEGESARSVGALFADACSSGRTVRSRAASRTFRSGWSG